LGLLPQSKGGSQAAYRAGLRRPTPLFVKLTEAQTHEIKVAKEMTFPKGSVVVVDRGYLDFGWLKVLDRVA